MHYNISVIKLATKRTNQNFLKEHIHTERAKANIILQCLQDEKAKKRRERGEKQQEH